MRRSILVTATLLAACSTSSAFAADRIVMAREAPWSEGSRVAPNIRSECVKLPGQLPAYTQEFARAHGIDVALVDSVDPGAAGRVLVVEITDAVSRGNAFIGHQKYSEVEGTLYEDGTAVAGFRGARNSMGGAFAGYKGSCSVLGRTIKALGKDIAGWLRDPRDGAGLGDM